MAAAGKSSIAAKAAAVAVAARPTRVTYLRHQYEPRPSAINATTFVATQLMNQDPTHPFHIPVRRRLKAFDGTKLTWSVRCPATFSHKRVVRSWIKRKVRAAFEDALRQRGLDRDGRPLPGAERATAGGGDGHLGGALAVIVNDVATTASRTDITEACASVIDAALRKQRSSSKR